MKKNAFNKLYKFYTLLFSLLALSKFAEAQQDNLHNLPALELQELRSFWKTSSNAAGLLLDKPFQYSTITIGHESYTGDFYRPQLGASGTRQRVQTEGNLFVNGLYLSGSFSYVRDNIKDANYNASLIDPLRGMPYINADLNASNWNNQHYNLRFSIATPVFKDKWSFGLNGNYKSSSGAKQRDIRAENYLVDLSLMPSLLYSPAKNHHIGLSASYRNFKEESQNSNVNTYVDQTYYQLLGLGAAISRIGNGSVNNYLGDAVGGEIQYHYQAGIDLFLRTGYTVEAEDVRESFVTPRAHASVLRKIWNTSLVLQKTVSRLSHFVELNHYLHEMDGIQYITERDNSSTQAGFVTLLKNIRSTYSVQRSAAKYNLVSNRGNEYSWKVNAGIGYEKIDDRYLLPGSVKHLENILYTISGAKNFILSPKRARRFSIGAEMGFNTNLSGRYVYGGEHADYPTVTGLEQNDFNYLKSDYLSIAVPILYTQQLRQDSKTNLFLRLSGHYIHTNSFAFNNRKSMSFSLGCNF